MNYNDPKTVPPIWKVGDVILARYEVKQVFTSGGMGLVYRVHHRDWDMDLAAKSPRPEFFQSPQQIENFEREAETWVNLGLHPHIVSCYYVRRLGGIPRIFAEYLEGGTLADWIRTKQLYEGGKEKRLERIIDVAIQFAWGLHYAHEKGLVHQDVKPGNVLLALDGTTKVADFGLANARSASAESTTVAQQPGQSILVPGSGYMTPEYASPEQLRGEHLSRKTDIWSWAVSLLEMLLGELTWSSGLAAPAMLEEIADRTFDDELLALLDSCFGSRSRPRWISFDPVLEALISYYTSHFGIYLRSTPTPVELLANGLNNRGASLLDLGQLEPALKCFEKALQVNTTQAEAHYNHGLVLWRAGRITDAELVRRLSELHRTQPDDWRVNYYLGLIQMERREFGEAISALESAAALSSSSDVLAALRDARFMGSTSVKRPVSTFEGHTGAVSSICLTADGRLALSGSWDHTLRLWDVNSGACIRSFAGHSDQVTSVCMSADNRYALSGSRDKTLRFWDIALGTCLRRFECPSSVHSVSLSCNNLWALSGGGDCNPLRNEPWVEYPNTDCTVRVWDVSTGRCTGVIEGHKYPVASVCLSLDGQSAISASGDTLKLWAARSLTLEGRSPACWSDDNRFALSASKGNALLLWDMTSGKCLRTMEGHGSRINAVAINRTKTLAASSSGRFYKSFDSVDDDLSLRIWNLKTGQCLRTIDSDFIFSICISPNSEWALSGGYDGTLRVVELNSLISDGRYRCPMAVSQITPGSIALRSATLFHGSIATALTALLKTYWNEALGHARAACAVANYGKHVTALDVWNAAGLHCHRQRLRDSWEVWGIAALHITGQSEWISADASRALVVGANKNVEVWDLVQGRTVEVFAGPSGDSWNYYGLSCVCLSPNGRCAVFGTGNDFSQELGDLTSEAPILELWDMELKTVKKALWFYDFAGSRHKYITTVAFSPDSRWAFAASNHGEIRMWEVSTGRCLRDFEAGSDGAARKVNSICISADGRWLASGSGDDTRFDAVIRIWDISTGRHLQTLSGHAGGVNCICISSDQRWVLSGSNDHTMRLWDIDTGRVLRVFECNAGVHSVCLSVDMRWVVSGGADRMMRLWSVGSGMCLVAIERVDGRLFLSCDSRFLVSGGRVRKWELDWEFEPHDSRDWDEGARPYLASFIELHTTYSIGLLNDREPTNEEIALALTRSGRPLWAENDFERLLYTLACAGYGWLRQEGVRRELDTMASTWLNTADSRECL